MSDDDILDAIVRNWFFTAHPHDAYEQWPEEFWIWFHAKHPTISREQLDAAMRKTDGQER